VQAVERGRPGQPIKGDAREAAGHGVRAKRSKSGAISFELLAVEGQLSPGGGYSAILGIEKPFKTALQP
jgi:hypothetical protein